MRTEVKRFFGEARAEKCEDRFSVRLDNIVLRTPARADLTLPTDALAQAVAAEWNAQGAQIDPRTMPLTRLANVAIDRALAARGDLIAMIAQHGETDLLCHRAAAPAALVKRQSEVWDPLLAWALDSIGFSPSVVIGVTAAANDTAPLTRAADALDNFSLTALAHAVALSGSAILGFALLLGRLDGECAFLAAHVDELHQLEAWGEDGEARARLEARRAEFHALARFVAALA